MTIKLISADISGNIRIARKETDMNIVILENEYWWVGEIVRGHEMPYSRESVGEFDLEDAWECDQFAPLMLSSKGRYVWSDRSFRGEISGGMIKLYGDGEFKLCEGYKNLKGAYLAAMKAHFHFDGNMPDSLFWKAPQYNTWIELGTNQTSDGILEYAESIIKNGLKPGVLMIDEGWQQDYGVFEFNKSKIPDPGELIDKLHKMGFKVMLWTTPLTSAAGDRFKELRDKNFLVRDKDGKPAVREWWCGYSAVIDLTNPNAVKWYQEQLNSLIDRYGIDGYKLDAGDRYFYRDDDIICGNIPAREQTKAFNKIGESYRFNEYRAAWNFGGHAVVARLHDKKHSWNDFGLNTLIPHTIIQGLCGYAYCCPDMVGGGMEDSFKTGAALDEELFTRWAQANALMSMMQISIAPWRVLKKENAELVKAAIKLHEEHGDLFYSLAQNASKTGEPIVRHMAYEFPDGGFETENTQFMLGGDILVAPVLEKGAVSRTVRIPEGKWKTADGKVYEGCQSVTVDVPIDKLFYLKKID